MNKSSTLKLAYVDEGFCRVVYYHQTEKNRYYYCLQDEGAKFGGVKLYRCTDDGDGYHEPSHEVKFTKVFVLFERVPSTSPLGIAVNLWIDKYEADFKASVADYTEEMEVRDSI